MHAAAQVANSTSLNQFPIRQSLFGGIIPKEGMRFSYRGCTSGGHSRRHTRHLDVVLYIGDNPQVISSTKPRESKLNLKLYPACGAMRFRPGKTPIVPSGFHRLCRTDLQYLARDRHLSDPWQPLTFPPEVPGEPWLRPG